MLEKLLSVKEVSEILGVSEKTVKYTLNLKYVKVASKRMYEESDVEKFIKLNKRGDYIDNCRRTYVI